MKPARVNYLIFGADGMLGTDLALKLKNDKSQSVIGPHYFIRNPEDVVVDITDREKVFDVIKKFRPKIVINAAAYTDVDGCETNFDNAFNVNGTAVGHLAEACNEFGARFVHISTDYVFDGEKGAPYLETDIANPISKYGISKAEGEIQAKKAEDFLLIRTAWLYGKHGKNFVTSIIKNGKEKGALAVVDDQTGSPTYTLDLIDAILKLLKREAAGVFQVTNSGSCSWFEYSKKILELSGLSNVEVRPITTKESGRHAPRPKYSVLDTSKFEKETSSKMRPWFDALNDFIKTLPA